METVFLSRVENRPITENHHSRLTRRGRRVVVGVSSLALVAAVGLTIEKLSSNTQTQPADCSVLLAPGQTPPDLDNYIANKTGQRLYVVTNNIESTQGNNDLGSTNTVGLTHNYCSEVPSYFTGRDPQSPQS